MAIHSSILGLEIPWTEEPDGPQSVGMQRVGCNWVTENTSTLPQNVTGFGAGTNNLLT